MSDTLEKIKKDYRDFAYIVSHDLGAPLRQIKGFLELFLDEMEDLSDEQEVYKRAIFDAVTQADVMVARLFDFSSLNDHEVAFQEIDLNSFFQNVKKNHAFVDISENVSGVLTADLALFEKIVVEILDNAKKFKKDDCDLVVSINTDKSNEGLIIFIADNGQGVEKDYLEGIFDPMRSLHPKGEYEGCGMGLTLCRKMTDMQGGEVWGALNEDGGLTIFLKFKE